MLLVGIWGIVVVGFLVVLMSFFVGVFNVFFMLFMMDLYFKFKLDVFEKILVCVGCIVIGVMVVIGLFWILVI